MQHHAAVGVDFFALLGLLLKMFAASRAPRSKTLSEDFLFLGHNNPWADTAVRMTADVLQRAEPRLQCVVFHTTCVHGVNSDAVDVDMFPGLDTHPSRDLAMKTITGQHGEKTKLRINKPVAHPQERGARVYLGEIWKILRDICVRRCACGVGGRRPKHQRICKFEFLLAFLGRAGW